MFSLCGSLVGCTSTNNPTPHVPDETKISLLSPSPDLLPPSSTIASLPSSVSQSPTEVKETVTFTPLPTETSSNVESVTVSNGQSMTLLGLDSVGSLIRLESSGTQVEALLSIEVNPDSAWPTLLYDASLVSKDGQWLVADNGNGYWVLLDVDNQEVMAEKRGIWPAWAPDSQQFAYLDWDGQGVRDRWLCMYDVANQHEVCPFWESEDKLLGASWSPSSSWIVVAAADSTHPACCYVNLWLIHSSTKESRLIGTFATPPETSINSLLAWLPDETLLIKAANPAIFFSPEASLTTEFTGPVLDISPDGQYFLQPDGQIKNRKGESLFSLPELEICSDTLLQSQSWAWSFESQLFAYFLNCQGKEQEVYRLSVISLLTGTIFWQQTLPQPLQLVSWTPLGEFLLLQEVKSGLLEETAIWRISATGTEPPEEILRPGLLLGVVPQWE